MSGFYTYEGKGELSDVDEISQGLLHPGGKTGPRVVYLHSSLLGSDYDGGLVARANVEAFRENVSDDWQGKLFWPLHGSHGTFGIAVLGDVMDESSALYESNDEVPGRHQDEELIDAANNIRELVEGLDNYPLIDDEVHSRLEQEAQELQFPEAARDIYRSAHSPWMMRNPAAEDRISLPGWMLEVLTEGMEEVPEGWERLAEEDSLADHSFASALAAFYAELGGDLFSTYPYEEGGGSVVFDFAWLMEKFHRALEGLRAVSPEAAEVVAAAIVKAMFDPEAWQLFNHGSLIYTMLREGQELDRMQQRDPSAFAVLQDAALSNPPKAAKLAEVGALVSGVKSGALSDIRAR